MHKFMKINLITVLAIQASHLPKIIVSTILFFSCTTIFGFSPNSLISQNPKVTIDREREVTIYEVLEIIGNQTECKFIYQSDIFKELPRIKLKKGTIKVNELLKQCLPPSYFSIITTKDNYITITRRISTTFPQGNIKGVVTDSLGNGMAGVNIVIKNTAKGTQSNLDGQYTIIAHPSDTLVFTYISFKLQEITVGNRTIINVVMAPDATSLDQVVINAGYYKVSDSEKTGSISRVTSREIESQPVANPLAALQGRAAGVDIQQTTGVPGGGFDILIRGRNSIAAGNNPLYVIDGVPFDSATLGSGNTSGGIIANADISPLNAINPNDIENIEILKDADATAIYGSRGANGVILITTKKGKKAKTTYNVNVYSGVAQITKKIDLLNTQQYILMREEAFANDGIEEYPSYAYDVNGTWDRNRYTDWQDELIGGTAYTNNVSASISGGSEQTSFLLSGAYRKETTVFPGDYNYGRGTVHTQYNHNSLDKRFNLLFSANYAAEKNDLPGSDLSLQARYLPPNAPALYDSEGNLNWENGTFNNPLAQLESGYYQKRYTLIANTVLSYKVTPRLVAKVNLGYNDSRLHEILTYPNTIFNPDYGLTSEYSAVFINEGNRNSWIVEPQINWNASYGKLKLEALLGSSFQKQTSDQLDQYGSGFASNDLIESLNAASSLLVFTDQHIDYRYQAFFGRINVKLDEKFFINLTGRRDGSSRFGPNKRYANFGAVGAGYIFSRENIFEDSFLSYGKVRGSYGSSGNDQIGDYGYLNTYTTTGVPYNGIIGIAPTRLYNANYSWENNKKLDVGLETAFFKNAIAITADYYRNRSSNQLTGIPLPGTTGFQSLQANLNATVQNSGFEITINTKNLNSSKLRWNTSFNLTIPRNKLIAFPDLDQSSYSNQYIVGEPLTIKKLFHYTGLDPQTGIFTFEDYNNDGIISSPDDRQKPVDIGPKFYGGFSNVLTYKNWELRFFFNFKKQKATNNFYYGTPPGIMVNQSTQVLDHWQQPGDNAFMQQYTTGGNPDAVTAFSNYGLSDAAVSDASYIWLKNVAVSYTLTDKNHFGKCKVYIQGQNLLTLTNYKGGDPEQLLGFLPPLRQFVFGIDLTL